MSLLLIEVTPSEYIQKLVQEAAKSHCTIGTKTTAKSSCTNGTKMVLQKATVQLATKLSAKSNCTNGTETGLVHIISRGVQHEAAKSKIGTKTG